MIYLRKYSDNRKATFVMTWMT